ncbi:unnamed protein product [Schistosoma spindalis]|nr:unnamed protein product [Schistosoma spindale]
MKLFSLNFIIFFNLINFLLILIIITTNHCAYTFIHNNNNNNNNNRNTQKYTQKYNSLTQTMFISELKKLNVYLLEEESIGREVANLQFPINRINNSNENYLINNNNNNEEEKEEKEKEEEKKEKEENRKKSNYYQIFNSEPQSKYFHLDAKTGIIRVARRIDRDQLCPLFKSCCTYLNNINYFNKNFNLINNEQSTNCQLDLNIRSDDQYTNIITVSVHIIDINDNSPTWLLNSKSGLLNFPDDHQKQDVMHVYVSESSLIGDSIQLTPAVDQDAGSNNIMKYMIEPQFPEFQLEWTSLDRDATMANIQLSGDIQSSDIQSYSDHFIRSPPGPRHELRLIVRSPLDRETKSLYEFNLTAIDGGSPSRNATIKLHVHITDFNDNSPIFEKDTYIVDLHENARPHTPVIQVKANDIDEGSNAQIKYRISSLTKPEFIRLFTLDPITGWIHVQWEVDYEIHKKIILTVEANDGGSLPRSTTCIVEITVLDENDHSPELHFEPAHLTNYALVPENEKPGRLVAVFTAQDKDSGDNGRVSCRLAETRKWTFDTQNKEKLESLLLNPTEILFSLQQMHMPFSIIYKLTTASSFDREFISKITVWITCSDYGIPPRNSTGSVAVRISDVNDEPPIFSQTHYYFNINENTEIGTIINKINATDPDEGENAKLTFWLSGQNANYFDVNKATGYLTVQKLLDREMINELRFQIHAADNGMPSLNSSADITITIQDVNDNPPSILNKIEFYILENHTASLAIGKITAYDADIGRNAEITFTLIQCIAYGLKSFNSSDSIVHESYENYLSNKKNFSQSLEIMYTFFIAKDGQIYLGRSKLDRELYPLYELTVRVEDQGTPKLSSTTIVLIHILDVNDNTPQFIFPSIGNNTVYVPKETKPGTYIAKLYAIDIDSAENGRITYGIKPNEHTDIQSLFELDPITGDIILKRSLDYNIDTLKLKENKNFNIHSRLSIHEMEINRRNQSIHGINKTNFKQNELKNKLYESQMAYSLIVTVTDNGEPPLKSSTILRILFTPPFYPPSDSKESPNPLIIKHSIRHKSLNNHPDYTKSQSISNELDFDTPVENELTGIGVLLGLVTAIGLFVCFLILVIMITFYQSRRLNEHRKQLIERRNQVYNQHQVEQTHQSQLQQRQNQQNPELIQLSTVSPSFNTQSTRYMPHSILRHIPVEQLNKSDKNLADSSRQYYLQTFNEVMPNSQSELMTSFTTL